MLRLSEWLLVATQSTLPASERPHATAVDSGAVAVRAAPRPPRIDGRLDDPAWALAIPIGRFTQREPVEGAPASLATDARVVFTDDAIYVSVRASDPEPALLMAPLARRDERPAGDWIGIMIDSHYDRRTAFEFAVNPAGVRRDVYRFNDFEADASWDAVWEVAVARDDGGWSAEFRIPLSQLRFVPREPQRFGFNAYREIGRTHEVQQWRLLPRNQRGVVSRFGDLVGLDGLRPSRRLEVAPFVAGRASSGAERGTTNATIGADLRLPLSPGVSLAASLNPDFGQVEADPAVINLSTTEVFFPERRPLFVDGADYFRFSLSADTLDSDALLYTHRIGRVPQLAPGGSPTTILAASKLLGRTAGGWSVAALAAVTAKEAGHTGPETIEPRTLYGAVRLSRDFNHGRTLIGGFATVVRRELPPEVLSLHSGAVALALTGSHRFGKESHIFRALVAVSEVTGSTEAIAITQQSPVHYFQRPDAGYASFDPKRTSLSGLAAWVELARDRGPVLWSAKLATHSPGFEVNDAGFMAQAGRHLGRAALTRRWLEPHGSFRRTDVGIEAFWEADYDGRAMGRGAGLRASALLRNYTTIIAEAWRALGGIDPVALRGGPALVRPGNYFFRLETATDPNRPARIGAGLVVRPRDEDVSREIRLTSNFGWRASSRLDLELTPAYEWNHHREQYVGTARVDGTERYLVGFLKQRTLRVGLRAGFTFTPVLTLQTYVQPFATTGSFPSFSQVADPAARRSSRRVTPIPDTSVERRPGEVSFDLDADAVADLTVPPPDFTVLSLRSTIVLRWEYRSASAASLVVQHERDDQASTSDGDLFRVVGRLGAARQTTRFLLKISHWLSL